jgi:hypothetical protein
MTPMRAASLLARAALATLLAAGCASPAPTFAVACIAADDEVIARAQRARVSVRDRDGVETLARVVTLRGADAEASFPLRIPVAPRGGDPEGASPALRPWCSR